MLLLKLFNLIATHIKQSLNLVNNKIISLFTLFLVLINWFGWIAIVYAEGSRELVKYGGHRPYLEFINQETAGIKRQPSIKVFVKAGEQVNVGSSVPKSANGDADIVYRWPSGSGSFDVGITCGLIDTVDKEAVGPLPKPGGYTPCTFVAPTTGIYEIEFRAPEFTGIQHPQVKKGTDSFPTDNNQHQAVAAWDVTVFKTPNDPNTEQSGRAYATFLPIDMGANDLALNSRIYVLNNLGYLHRINLNGIDPFLLILFANSKGFQDKADETGKSIYHSVEISEIDNGKVFLHDPNESDEGTDITYKIFFNPPAADLPLDVEVPLPSGDTTWLRSTLPALLQINDFKFIGDEGRVGQTGIFPLKGHFSFTADKLGDYIITIDANDNGIFGDGNDRVLIGSAEVGENIIPWDGLDSFGEPLLAQTITYNGIFTLSIDTMHFPLLDVENNPNGLIIDRVNCDQLPCTVEDSTVFYNNSNFLSDLGAPNPISAIKGIDSSNGAQKFSNHFGDLRGIDTWVSLTTKPVLLNDSLELKQADISVSKTHDSLVPLTPGGPITYLITVHNAGPSHVTGIQVQDNLPATITEPFWTCQVSPSTLPPPAIQNRCAVTSADGPPNTTVDLQQGAKATFTVEATISSTVAEGAVIDNSVTITRPKDVTNPFGDQPDIKTETATHSVTLAPPTNQLPVAQDKNTAISNTQPVLIPALAAQDSDGSVVSYTVFQLPTTNQGKLYLGDPDASGTLVTEGQKLTPAQISNLYFKPNLSFVEEVGEKVIFNYQAVDNKGSVSNIAKVTITVTIPPINQFSPVADDKLAPPVPNDMIVQLPALSGHDDVEVVSYTITTIPTINQGILYLDDPKNGGKPIPSGLKLTTPHEVASIFFKPNPGTCEQVTFNYLVTDDQGEDSIPATVTIPVICSNQVPVADDKTILAIPNNVTIALPALTATDDGTIKSYKIMTIPPENQAILYLDDPTKDGKQISAGQILTPDEVEILFFKSANSFSGGKIKFTYTALDNYDAVSNTATVTIQVVVPPNQPPIASDDRANTNPNTPITISILANDSDPDGELDPQSLSITNLLTNNKVIINPNGTVTYTPNLGFANNTDTFTYQVCDTGNPPQCDTAMVTITVTIPTQLPPVAKNLTVPTIQNNTVVQLPPLVATDPDGTVTTYTIETLPEKNQGILYLDHPAQAASRLVNIGEQLTPAQIKQLFFQPNGNFIGNASFIYSATDNLNAISNQALVIIPVVAPVNSLPIANDDIASTDPNTPVTISILTNDNDPENELDSSSVRIVLSPPHGKVIVNLDGTVIYTPNSDFTTGIDVFQYEVCDAGIPPQCDTAEVKVTVPNPTNHPPLAENKTTLPSLNNVVLPLPSLFATDSDGSIVLYTITTLPSPKQGVLYLGNPTKESSKLVIVRENLSPMQVGELFFQPNGHFIGQASFTYTATDNDGAISNFALVTIPVQAPTPDKRSPLANDDQAVTVLNTTVTIAMLDNDSDLESQFDPSRFQITSPPSHGNLTVNLDGSLSYTPYLEFTGLDVFTYEICDLGTPAQCDTAQVTVSVILPPIAQDIITPSTPNNISIAIPALSARSDSTIVSYTITTLPPATQGILYLGAPPTTPLLSEQVLSPTAAQDLWFQPNSNWVGEVSFNYQATDAQDNMSTIATVTIPVTLPPYYYVPSNQDKYDEPQFSGKIWSGEGKVGKQLSIDVPEYIQITGYIQPSLIHQGQLADIVMIYHWTAYAGESTLTVPVTIASQQRLTAAAMELTLFEGYLIGLAGQFDLSLGYRLNTGKLFSAPILSLTVRPNHIPTAFTLSPQTVLEYSPPDTLIGSFSTEDTDNQEQFRYGLVENPGNYFKVVGDELRVNQSLPSQAEQPSYAITIRSIDLSGDYIEQAFVITTLSAEIPPQEIYLSHHTVLENSPGGTIIGRLWTQDLKPSHYSYELINQAHVPFTIAEDLLLVAPEATLDFETQPTYTLTVRSQKADTPYHLEQTFTIDLINQIDVTVLAQVPVSRGTRVPITLKLLPDVTHQGEQAEFTSVILWRPLASKETFLYRLDRTYWVPSHGDLAELLSGQAITLNNQSEVTLVLDPPFDLNNGEVNWLVGYQLPTGEIFYTAVPWQ